ncbi:MAG: hypothetical protein A2Y38_00340 [Spirochaetes bacterium GWB1_59_5]|nr:MAG: hypothetical protein A2Y38_00340 [Spirochaetes bacterium GWB1_59_5]
MASSYLQASSMSNVYKYKELDREQFAQLVTAWVDAAQMLAAEIGDRPVYQDFRSLMVDVIEQSYPVDIRSMDEDFYYTLRIPRVLREELGQTWENARRNLRLYSVDTPEFKALDAAVSALRKTPDNVGKMEGGLDE